MVPEFPMSRPFRGGLCTDEAVGMFVWIRRRISSEWERTLRERGEDG